MRLASVAIASAGVFFVLAPVAVAEGSATVTVGVSSFSIVAKDVVFDGDECVALPITISRLSGSDMTFFRLEARQQGSSDLLYDVPSLEPAQTSQKTYMEACPYGGGEGPGTYTVTGYGRLAGDPVVPFEPFTVTVGKAPSRFTILKATIRQGTLRLSGRITASTSEGDLGTRSKVTILVRDKGTWKEMGAVSADSFGKFASTMSWASGRPGSKVTLIASGSSWATDASALVTAR